MFYDENNEIKINEINENHRKIIYYDAWKDSFDNNPGHGTHVASIISGKSLCGNVLPMYNGIAPNSKLYFVDMQKTGEEYIYDDFDKEVFINRLRGFDGGISSNSWGSTERDFTNQITRVYDQIAYENSDILFVFSAGNNADKFSIDSPASSKNVLTVGATDALPGQQLEYSSQLTLEAPNGEKFSLTQTSWSKSLWDLMQGEEPIYNYTKFLTTNGNCDDVYDASEKGTKLVLSTKFPSDCKMDKQITVLIVNDEDFEKIQKLNSITLYPEVDTSSYSNGKASFASAGPATSGLMKPELTAPGINTGPLSLGNSNEERYCNSSLLYTSQGTSEATPLISGLAALLREKIRKEYKIDRPSSNLLKSLLILSTSSSKSTKNQETGYGTPILSKILENVYFSFTNNQTIKGNKHIITKFKTDLVKPEIALSWLDPVISEGAAYPIYANVDLVLESPSGSFTYGYFEMFSTSKKLVVNKEEEGEWTLHVISSNYEGSVNFAVSVLGTKTSEQLVFTETEECVSSCSSSSNACDKGICKCSGTKIGTICSELLIEFEDGKRGGGFIPYGTRRVGTLKVPENMTDIELNILVEGLSIVLISANSFDPNSAFVSFKTYSESNDEIEYTISSQNYPQMKAGETLVFFIHSLSSSVRITPSFMDASVPDKTPQITPCKTPSPTKPPKRTYFPEDFDNLDYSDNLDIQTPKWMKPTIISLCAFFSVLLILLIIFIVIVCKRRTNNHEESAQMSLNLI